MNNSIVAQFAPECNSDRAVRLPRSGGRRESAELRRRAIGHALSLIGGYQACSRTELIRNIRSLDASAWEWITSADAQQLRSRFLPGGAATDCRLWLDAVK